MTETPEHRTEPATGRLNQVSVWVGIVAGVVFIVAVIFFSGFFFGRHARGWDYHGQGCGSCQMGPGDPGGMMGPGGMKGLSQLPSPTTTSVPSTPRP